MENELDLSVEDTTEEDLHELLDEKPEYVDVVKKLLKWRRDGYENVSKYSMGEGFNTSDANVSVQRLHHLKSLGVTEVTFNSNSATRMKLAAPEAVENVLRQRQNNAWSSGGAEDEEFKVPEELFAPVVGYNDIKERFRRAMETQSVRQSIALIGPPASGKTIFLEEVARLPEVQRVSGKSVSQAGFEKVARIRPNFIIIDEFDEVDGDVYSVLLNYMDPKATYSIKKRGKEDDIEPRDKCPVFATANSLRGVPKQNKDRFWQYNFSRYTKEDFEEVCRRMLPRDFDVSEELAEFIADRMREEMPNASIRDAERVGEVVHSKDEVDKEIEVMKKYSS